MTQELMNCLCRAIERNYYYNTDLNMHVKVICLEDIKSAVISLAVIDRGTLEFIIKVNAKGDLHNVITINGYITALRIQRFEEALSIGKSDYLNSKEK